MSKLVILDLDNTVWDVVEGSYPAFGPPCLSVENLHMYKRPFIDSFIESIPSNFKVGVWSAASNAFVHTFLEEIINKSKLEFILTRDDCVIETINNLYGSTTSITKPLSKINHPINDIVFLDDKEPEPNCPVWVKVPPFFAWNRTDNFFETFKLN